MGQERCASGINKLFCKGASGALVCADITDQLTIESAANWKKQIEENLTIHNNNGDDEDSEESTIPMLLVLNKYDLVEELVESGHEMEDFMTFQSLQAFAEEHGFIGAVCTSAKTGVGITEAVSALVRQILIKELAQEQNCQACGA